MTSCHVVCTLFCIIFYRSVVLDTNWMTLVFRRNLLWKDNETTEVCFRTFCSLTKQTYMFQLIGHIGMQLKAAFKLMACPVTSFYNHRAINVFFMLQ